MHWLTFLAFIGFLAATPQTSAAAMERVKVAPNSRGFLLADSAGPVVPWGFNYDRDYKMRLIEEYWIDEWATVEEDFRETKRLGANVCASTCRWPASSTRPTSPTSSRLSCGVAELERFIDQSKLHAHGWLGFYWGESPTSCVTHATRPTRSR